MRKFLFMTMLLQAPEGAGGAAAAAAPAPAATEPPAATGGEAAGQPPAASASPSAYRPEGLPDHLYGANDKETIDKVFKAFDGFRSDQAKRGELGEVPKDIAGYAFEPIDIVKPHSATFENDPFFKGAKEDALAAGMTTKQFNGFVNAFLGRMIAGNLVDDPYSPEAEAEALIPLKDGANAGMLPEERNREVDRRVRDNAAWLQAQVARGMPKEAAQLLEGSLDRAAAVKGVEWIRAQLRDSGPALGGQGAGAGTTAADLRARNADPRNDPQSGKYEPAFAAETTAMYQRFYGSGERA